MSRLLDSKIGNCGKIGFPELFFVNMMIDIDGIPARIAAHLLDHLTWHAIASQLGGKPVPKIMGREITFNPLRVRFVQSNKHRVTSHNAVDAVLGKPSSN